MGDEKTATITTGGMWKAIDSDPEAPPYRACLVLIYGTDLGRRYPIQDEVTIGREDLNGITIDLPSVSRFHARIFSSGDGWLVADLGSTNGTYVNGKEVSGEALLVDGDLIKLGRAILKFIAGDNIEAQFYEEIYRLTILDGLTGIHNKRYLLEFLEREIARAQHHGRPLSLAMLDIDHFKQLNDTHGHVAGDQVIEELVQLILPSVRREQLLARFGGEEFTLVLPETNLEQAGQMCEEIRRTIEENVFVFDGEPIRTTLSIGVASLMEPEARPEPVDTKTFLREADDELLRAKRKGRNRVMLAGVEE